MKTENEKLRGLLREARTTFEMWKDVAPAISLCADIDAALSQQAEPEGTTSDKYRAELYDEVWEKARSMGYGNVTDALIEQHRVRMPCRMWESEHAESPEYASGYNTALDHVAQLNAAPIAQTAPQPEQSWLPEAAKAFADAARKNIYPCPDKPNSLSGKLQALDGAIAAALSAQGDKP